MESFFYISKSKYFNQTQKSIENCNPLVPADLNLDKNQLAKIDPAFANIYDSEEFKILIMSEIINFFIKSNNNKIKDISRF